MARRRGGVDTAGGGGASDFLVIAVGVVLVGGFALVALGGAGLPTGACADAATKQASMNALSGNLGSFITNHLNKALPSSMNVTTLIRTKYTSGLAKLAALNNCSTAMPSVSVNFYKWYATLALAVPSGIGAGYALSSGVAADMTAMKNDGNAAHRTKYAHYTAASRATAAELDELAKKLNLDYGDIYHDVRGLRARAFDANPTDIYYNISNLEDYTTIESLV